MKRPFKSRKGFTLVELICSLALAAIITSGVAMLFKPVSDLSAALSGDVYADTVANATERYIMQKVNTANLGKVLNTASFTTVNPSTSPYRFAAVTVLPLASGASYNAAGLTVQFPLSTPTGVGTATGVRVYALLNLDGRLYDLGDITNTLAPISGGTYWGQSGAQINSKLSTIANLEQYRVFPDAFYNINGNPENTIRVNIHFDNGVVQSGTNTATSLATMKLTTLERKGSNSASGGHRDTSFALLSATPGNMTETSLTNLVAAATMTTAAKTADNVLILYFR
ncbi:MAG: prepilin-type N-terminal cleavage/methylation domain-containing protein [Oscillospiraceae bacterium]|jgi:prepilin-type N-terminal cleavage/methylation domain-containing protein|nr:prepilin-type N-terminal cleavage/methylation domain-containing protein [Oscillospiraceae bacterium]